MFNMEVVDKAGVDPEPAAEQSTWGGGGESLQLSTKAAIFKRVNFMIGRA